MGEGWNMGGSLRIGEKRRIAALRTYLSSNFTDVVPTHAICRQWGTTHGLMANFKGRVLQWVMVGSLPPPSRFHSIMTNKSPWTSTISRRTTHYLRGGLLEMPLSRDFC